MNRVHGLEGMRGLAAFWVFTHHFLLIFYPEFHFGEHSWLNHIFNAELAVTWFFVHSGFVLSWKTKNLTGTEYKLAIIDQSLRRYLRLLPPVLFSILLTYLVLKLGANYSDQYAPLVGSSWLGRYLNFGPNILEALYQSFFGVYFQFKSATTYNPNLWTIGYELISSYVLFVFLALFGWWKNSVWVFFLIGLFVSPWKGLMAFCLGAGLSRMPAHKTPIWALAIFTIFGFLISDYQGLKGEYLRSLGAALLMYVLLQLPELRTLLHSKPIRFLGDISYSLYALHFLVLISLTSYLGLHWQAHQSALLIVAVYIVTTLALVILSFVTWKLVDRPGIELAKRFSALFVKKPALGPRP